MHWLQSLDIGLFRFVNQTLSNPLFDVLMPFASGNKFFIPAVIATGFMFLWKGGRRGRLCVLMLALLIPVGDGLVCSNIKKAVARPRPYVTHSDVLQPAGKKGSKAKPTEAADAMNDNRPSKFSRSSMPSAHAMNMFTAMMVIFLYYRRSWRVMLPLASLVAFSRVYNGMHYPSDVLAGAVLGAGYAVAGVWTLNFLWRLAGRKGFPLWWEKMPSLVLVETNVKSPPPAPPSNAAEDMAYTGHSITADQQWLRLGWLVIAAVLLGRLLYLAGGAILLSEDEAYQWLWSKHLALSYYSKPLGIAVAQWIGTAIWGDTALGVRFLSPVLSAILGGVLLQFVARHTNGRTAFFFVLACLATPLLAVGGILMTIDPLVVFFFTLAMLAAWRAITTDSTAWWLVAGLGMGGTFLSKYFSPFQWASLALFFALCQPVRAQLRRPGLWLAAGINLLCALPVFIWNQQNGWITLTHLSERGSLDKAWHPTLKYFGEFVGGELGLLNVFFAVAVVWAVVGFLRTDFRQRHSAGLRPRLELFLLCQGIFVFGFYTLYSFKARVQLNWIATCVLPLFLFATLWWHRRWQEGDRKPAWFLGLGLALGLPVVFVCHNTDLIEKPLGRLAKMAPRLVPDNVDPLHRVRGYDQMARVVGECRTELLKEGRPVFIIADHYGRAGLLCFYLPEARLLVKGESLVTIRKTDRPKNQLWFWPGYGYTNRVGQNALFVWNRDTPAPAPDWLLADFESVTDLGMFETKHHGRECNRIQLFACRGKR